MAPPELKKLPRSAAKQHSSVGGKAKAGVAAAAGVLSDGAARYESMMEIERENAIRRYHEMKECKAKEGDVETAAQGVMHVMCSRKALQLISTSGR